MNFLHTTTYIDLSAVSHIFSAPIPNYGEVSSLPNNWLQHCRIEYDKERSLYDSLITEAYNKNGVCMTYYIVSFSTENQKLFGEDNNKKIIDVWEKTGMCVIVLQCKNEIKLHGIAKYLDQWGIPYHLYIDEGMTEISMGTATALATGIIEEDKQWMFETMKLYK